MSKRLEILRKRFMDAKADADASKREVRQASAAKLAQIRALPDPAARLAGLKDPALLPSDRQILEHALADVLPRRRIRFPLAIGATLRSGLRHARYHWRGLVVVTLISIPVMVIGGFAVHNTLAVISPLAWASGFPFSIVSSRANSALRRSIRSAHPSSANWRNRGFCDQFGRSKACLAADTAASASGLPLASKAPILAPLEGSILHAISPEAACCQCPPMRLRA